MGALVRETVCQQVADEQIKMATALWREWKKEPDSRQREIHRVFVFGMCQAAAVVRLQGPVSARIIGTKPSDLTDLGRKLFRGVTESESPW